MDEDRFWSRGRFSEEEERAFSESESDEEPTYLVARVSFDSSKLVVRDGRKRTQAGSNEKSQKPPGSARRSLSTCSEGKNSSKNVDDSFEEEKEEEPVVPSCSLCERPLKVRERFAKMRSCPHCYHFDCLKEAGGTCKACESEDME